MNARKSTAFLYFLGKLNPRAWDALIPHGPKVSRASREYFAAQCIKGFAAELNNRSLAPKLLDIQHRLAESAAKTLVADFDDDNWCGNFPKPPHPLPIPVPVPDPEPYPWLAGSEVMLSPQPLPPKERQREIGGYLSMLSEITSLDDVARDLQSIANTLMGGRPTPAKRQTMPVPPSRLRNVRPLVSQAGI
jgi:hypothetical protein